MNTVCIITSGQSEEYGYVIDSVWPSQEAALGYCKKLLKEEVAKANGRSSARFDLNLEQWVVGSEATYHNIPCWEVSYNFHRHGSSVEEANVIFRETYRTYAKSVEEFRLSSCGQRLEVKGPDKDECLRILTSLLG